MGYANENGLSVVVVTLVALGIWLLVASIPSQEWQELFDRLYGFLD
jgi:hypothetical protein